MRIQFTSLLIFAFCLTAFAQALPELEEEGKKKKLNLSFGIDYGIGLPISIKTNHLYKGEVTNFNDEWSWLEEEKAIIQIDDDDTFTQRNFKFNLMLSITENLNVGLSYKLLYNEILRDVPSNYFYFEDYIFFSICGTVDYEFKFPFHKQLYLNPTVSAGIYQDQYLYGTTGKNFYYDAKLALAYRLFDKLSIRAWASYDHFLYRENKPSEIFPDKTRIEKIDFQFVNWGLGLSYRFFIYPD